jgi:DNA-binding Xre family transcriptional regulator
LEGKSEAVLGYRIRKIPKGVEVTIDGTKLRDRRYERFLNAKELAERAGLNPWTVHKLESGNYPAGNRPDTVRKIAAALEVSRGELLED